jgi:hypothetical protein
MFISLVAIVASIAAGAWAYGLGEVRFTYQDTTVIAGTPMERLSLPAVPLIFYLVIFLCLLIGGGHFRLKEVQTDS